MLNYNKSMYVEIRQVTNGAQSFEEIKIQSQGNTRSRLAKVLQIFAWHDKVYAHGYSLRNTSYILATKVYTK